jgi:hypothetical protein
MTRDGEDCYLRAGRGADSVALLNGSERLGVERDGSVDVSDRQERINVGHARQRIALWSCCSRVCGP